MLDLDDGYFGRIEDQTRPVTAAMLKELYGFHSLPKTNTLGVMVHGWGRRIEETPISAESADMELNVQISAAQDILRGRIFQLIANREEFVSRLPALYAIADVLGAQRLRSWDKFWELAQLGDWDGVVAEVLDANLSNRIELDKPKRKTLITIIMKMHSGALS